MHISDGVLPAAVQLAGFVTSGAAVAVAIRRVRDEDLPRMAVVTATFFVGSLIHIPLPIVPVPVHLVLNGLAGLLLGPTAIVAVAIGVTFQALVFGHGGVVAIGINVTTIGFPAILTGLLFRRALAGRFRAFAAFVGAGGASVMTAVLVTILLWANGDAFETIAPAVLLASLPVALVEGMAAVAVISFLLRVEPRMLGLESPDEKVVDEVSSTGEGE